MSYEQIIEMYRLGLYDKEQALAALTAFGHACSPEQLAVIAASGSGGSAQSKVAVPTFGQTRFGGPANSDEPIKATALLPVNADGSEAGTKRCAMIDERHNGSHVWEDGTGTRYVCPGPNA